MPYQMEPHALRDRVRGKLLFLPATPALLVAMWRRGRPTELWIGDSHAMAVNREVTNAMFMRAPEGQLILRCGPRLMFSLARDGFPPRVMRVARLVRRAGRRGALLPVFSAGEIDVRAHLAARPDASYAFVAEYVARCLEVAELLRAERVGFLVPLPPVDAREEDVWFPIVGTLAERAAAQRRLREALAEAVAAVPHAVLLDFTDLVENEHGGMPVTLTLDGCHANLDVIRRIRARVAEERLLDAA